MQTATATITIFYAMITSVLLRVKKYPFDRFIKDLQKALLPILAEAETSVSLTYPPQSIKCPPHDTESTCPAMAFLAIRPSLSHLQGAALVAVRILRACKRSYHTFYIR